MALLVAFLASNSHAFWFQSSLAEIHQQIQTRYPNVEHLSIDEFERIRNTALVFDVREADEYAVSHIDSAIRLSPSIDTAEFLQLHGNAVRGKTVVFYCSVGRRSAALVEQLSASLNELEAVRAVNLEGGLFKWVNNDYPVTGNGIHPYNRYWSRLITDKKKIVYSRLQQPEDE